MNHLKLLLAFGLGFVSVTTLGFAADATAGRAELHATSALERRVRELEETAERGELGQQVVEPFQVVDQAGKEIFYAGGGVVRVSHPDDPDHGYVQIAAGNNGGSFSANSLVPGLSVDLNRVTTASLDITENSDSRITLGRDSQQRNYRLKFLSGSGQPVAGIGVSSDTDAGLALIGDQSGNKKANIGVTNGTGFVQVVHGENVLASLTEGEHKGGYLLLCGAKACDPPMVDAGDAGGYGVVRTGPRFYIQGPTGAPGSFLKGKPQ